MLVRELLKKYQDVEGHKELFMDMAGLSYSELPAKEQEECDPSLLRAYEDGIARLKEHVPLQYIVRKAYFFGFPFYVDERVLIPRYDSETLIAVATSLCKEGRVLDLCTGSGCLGITFKLLNKNCDVLCTDISPDALEVAKKNAGMHHTEISFLKSDLFSEISGTFDLILSNPPYIAEWERGTLDAEVRDFEPGLALFSPEDGYYHLKRIISRAGAFLKPGGYLCLEIGDTQGERVKDLMENAGFCDVTLTHDPAGRTRVATGKYTCGFSASLV